METKESILALLQGKWDGGFTHPAIFEISNETIIIKNSANQDEPTKFFLEEERISKKWLISMPVLMIANGFINSIGKDNFTIYEYAPDSKVSVDPQTLSLSKPDSIYTFTRLAPLKYEIGSFVKLTDNSNTDTHIIIATKETFTKEQKELQSGADYLIEKHSDVNGLAEKRHTRFVFEEDLYQ